MGPNQPAITLALIEQRNYKYDHRKMGRFTCNGTPAIPKIGIIIHDGVDASPRMNGCTDCSWARMCV